MSKQLTLILGGARSGKSNLAERLAGQYESVLFVATAEPLDEDMERRIARHKISRPHHWMTLEEPVDLASSLLATDDQHDICLVDCLTVWVSNLLLRIEDRVDAEDAIVNAAERLLDAYDISTASWIVVSNEVGLGVVPPTPLGRRYRDALGRVNQLVAARADKVYFMVAGLALELKSAGAIPLTDVDH
ncbi:MAG: bifunctional adenosylcobinamide kinase/adenosylcobinamide-phosphate guanylyltransferase [Dehalococcoidia bacterium]|nr:bifunctional adenosylcobinamide kinase/adenosylcobinamide-phosphate guanylyltransferase [Dehalococcoidia bacterium]